MTVFEIFVPEFRWFKAVLDAEIGPRSELSRESFEVGRELATFQINRR